MSVSWRAAAAAVVAFALAAVPVFLDRCAVSCDAHRDASLSRSSPECHHAQTPGSRVGARPSPCGHDHSGASAAAGASEAPRTRAPLAAHVTIAPDSTPPVSVAVAPLRAARGLPSALPPTSLPLRI